MDREPQEAAIRILLIEDDEQLASRLTATLTEAGFTVERAMDGDAGWYLGLNESFDVVVLDLGLPKLPGIEVLKRWRAAGRTMPVLILTARHTWTERVDGLNAGADDYLVKPFHNAELVARLRALIRRTAGAPHPVLRHGDLTLDTTAGTVKVGEEAVTLTAHELKILTYLMLRAGRIVPAGEIIDHIYTMDESRDANTVEVFIGRLRKKIGRETIKTIRGLGYRLG